MDEPTRHGFTSQGLGLSYVDWGNPEAPLLALIHGTRDHARSWDWAARRLRDRYHVVALDLRGHGDSAHSPDGAYLSPYHLLDVANFLDLFGEAPAVLVAHSFGGGLAARYAGVYPDRVAKLVVVDGMGPATHNYEAWDKEGLPQRTRDWVKSRRDPKMARVTLLKTEEDAVARMAAANPHLSPDQVRHLAIHGIRPAEGGFVWKFDPMVSAFGPEDFAIHGGAYWREVTAPTLILYGSESWGGNPEADGRSAYFRNQRTVRFEGAGHWLHHDQFEPFMNVLEDFLT